MSEHAHPLVPPVPPLRVGHRADGGGALWIDPDQAQRVVDQLRRTAIAVHDLGRLHQSLIVEPPSADEVSRNVAVQANLMADRARDFVDAWARQLGDAALRLEDQLYAHRATEEHNRGRMA
ncbi:MAG: hypothetical protein ACT4RN_10895 [Pseudonocardia sp.]